MPTAIHCSPGMKSNARSSGAGVLISSYGMSVMFGSKPGFVQADRRPGDRDHAAEVTLIGQLTPVPPSPQ